MAERYPLIRTIYLYLFAILGLVLITIGSVRFVNMGLKTFVFTQADQDQHMMYPKAPMPVSLERVEKYAKDENLTPQERDLVKQWISDYKTWKDQEEKIDYRLVRRHQDAAMNIALMLIGLPLYLYHWRTIQKETRDDA